MTWLSAAFWAWFGWNVLAPLAFIALAILLALGGGTIEWVKQSRCKHVSYRETSACDAICNHCNKNLGFIGAVREARIAKSSVE